MKKFSRILVVLAVLSMAIGLMTGCGNKKSEKSDNQSSVEQIKKNGKIKVGVFSDKPPFGYVDKNGKNQGYDVVLAHRLAKDLLGDENKVEFVLVEAASRVEFLQSNKVDVILANFTVTDERKEVVNYALPYMKVSLGVVSPNGKVITDVKQLKGKKLIVNKGTTAETYFTQKYPDIELLKYDQNTEAFNALKDGRGAALAHDNTLVYAWARENKGFTTGIKSLGEHDFIAPAVKKGNDDLKGWIDDEITKLTKEGFFEKDYKKTLLPVYGKTVEADTVIMNEKELKEYK